MNVLTKVSIPPDWTGDQANAVIELLDDISTAIWEVHEKKIIDAMHRQESMLERAARGEDDEPHPDEMDIPF